MPQKNDDYFPLGIIAGSGILPGELAIISKNLGKDPFIACVSKEIETELIDHCNYRFFSMGSVGSIIEYFKSNNVKNIVFAGSIKRPNLSKLKVDIAGAHLLTKILKQKFLGDDKLLSIVAKFLEDKGFKIVSAQDILMLESDYGQLSTNRQPSKQDLIDIELGLKVARALGTLDIGQSVIVEDGYVLGVEAAEGTDALIARCAILRKKTYGGVLVKVLKPNQDTRFDIPSIGPETIINLSNFKYNGVAIETSSVIIIDRHSTLEFANEYSTFIAEV